MFQHLLFIGISTMIMMFPFISLGFSGNIVQLKTDVFLGQPLPEYFRLIPNGIITCDSVFIRTFDRSGNLLHTMGGKGDGPGQFMRIGSVHTFRSKDGRQLLSAYDVRRLDLSLFEMNGKFLGRVPMLIRDIHPLKSGFAIVDLADLPRGKGEQGKAITVGQLDLNKGSKPSFQRMLSFHNYSAKLVKQRFGDAEHLIIASNDHWIVAASIAPELFLYDKTANLKKRAQISLYGFVESPEVVPRINNRKQGEKWMAKHSRLIGMFPGADGSFYIHYSWPDETNEPPEIVQKINADWTLAERVVLEKTEIFLGIEDDRLLSLNINDEGFAPIYHLHDRLFAN